MRRKSIVLSLLVLVVVAFVAVVPAAYAGQVTRIMLAQENVDVYMYKATTAGDFTASCKWMNPDDSLAPVWPAGSVNVVLQTTDGTLPYEDLNNTDLYEESTNPVSNSGTPQALVAGQEIWVSVNPYVGDWKYELTVNFTGTGQWYGKNGTATPVSTTTATAAGNAYGADGEVFIRTTGQWYGVGQYWPGDEATNTALTNWNLYTVERADYDSGIWPEYTYPDSWTSNTAKLYTGSGTTDSSTLQEGALTNQQINRWYSVTPQTWGAAAVPNVWPAGTGFRYPKPGSITATQAPLWMTYSFADAAPTKPGYSWSVLGFNDNANASKRAQSSDSASTSQINWRFQGQNFTWIYSKGSRGGIATVTVDGTLLGEVDQYNATTQFKQSTPFTVATGDATTWHDVVITGKGSRNPASTGFFIYHDAFMDPDETTPYAENNYDGMTTYAWAKTTVTGPSGGALVSTKSSNAATAFTANFSNNTAANRVFKWTYAKGTRGGIVNIYIDGVWQAEVDQYATGTTFSQTWTSLPLAKGWHTIFITGKGTKNGSSLGFFIYSDAFQAETQAVVEAE